MSRFGERWRQTNLGKEFSRMNEEGQYRLTRETRLSNARKEAEELISPLKMTAKDNPGSPAAKNLVLVSANVTSHIVNEVCDPDTQFYLNGVLASVKDFATGTTELEEVKKTRKTFLRSDIYLDYFNILQPNTTAITKKMAGAVESIDEVLFGALALDKKGMEELNTADKRGTTDFEMKSFLAGVDNKNGIDYLAHGLLPRDDASVYSIAEMSLVSHKAALTLEYSQMAAGTVASIPLYKGANAIERFYGIWPGRETSNPLFQERINKIVKETINPTQKSA